MASGLPRSEAALRSDNSLSPESLELAERTFDRLRELSFDGVGISRETYGPSETAAMELIAGIAAERGFETEWDPAKNLVVRLTGQDPERPVVATGSHLDSVPQGGSFDGAAGVIAGLIALIAAKEKGPPMRTMELIALRGEESAWFGGSCYFGSRAIAELLSQMLWDAAQSSEDFRA